MKGIKPEINIKIPLNQTNYDASVIKFEKEKGVCVIADGKQNKGIKSDKWAEFLCDKTPLVPIKSFKGFQIFVESIWEEFYEKTHAKEKDTHKILNFEKYGSFLTFAAGWFYQKTGKPFFDWITYGNSAIFIYNTDTDELLIPESDNSLLGFLKNPGLINWKEDSLNNKFFNKGNEQELSETLKIILASDVMAEHLVLSYLIIKSHDEKYWQILTALMSSDTILSNLLFNNRDIYNYPNFNDLLKDWERVIKTNNIEWYLKNLKQEQKIGEDDLSLQVITFDTLAPDFSTNHKPVTIKTFNTPVTPSPVKRTTKPKPFPKFKAKKKLFTDVLLDNKVKYLYHFTDKGNIESIIKLGGLYSWEYLLNNKIFIPFPGGDQLSRMLDSRFKLADYVRTSFCSDHPMKFVATKEGRIHNPVVLKIDPCIVTFRDTLFSDMNATSTNHHRGKKLEDLKRIRFDICLSKNYFNLSDAEKPYYQAEVMVKRFIPTKYILNLNDF